ncbi:MAG: addiction module protein [Gammaproteobacteria bacterium]
MPKKVSERQRLEPPQTRIRAADGHPQEACIYFWLEEAQRRHRELEEGAVKVVPAEEVKKLKKCSRNLVPAAVVRRST